MRQTAYFPRPSASALLWLEPVYMLCVWYHIS